MKLKLRALFIIVSLFAVVACGGGGKYANVTPENGVVKIKLSEVADGKAHYYQLKAGGKEVKFFVLKSSDGVVRAAFDACDVCYPEKKGYRQDGNYMVCNNCGQRFHSTRINVVKGGCNPSPVERATEGEYVVMQVAEIEKGAFYF